MTPIDLSSIRGLHGAAASSSLVWDTAYDVYIGVPDALDEVYFQHDRWPRRGPR